MLKTTTVGSFPRKDKQKDTLRKSTVTDQEAFEMIDWAVNEQCELGLDIIFGLKYGIIAPDRLATLAIFFEFVETITGPKFVSKQTFILF